MLTTPNHPGEQLISQVVVDQEKCLRCGYCESVNICHSPETCVGCLSCYWACPHCARVVRISEPTETVRISVNGAELEVPRRITVKRALEIAGIEVSAFPGKGEVSAPCSLGGCYGCLVRVDGKPMRACVTPIKEEMSVSTRNEISSYRIVHGPAPHSVGGKGTPWRLKGDGYIEVALWAAGCNLRCPQCQNHRSTYDNASKPCTPELAAKVLTEARRNYRVDRMAISGGEPTTNRTWLIEFFRTLRGLNSDRKARFHLDSNGTLLVKQYIDELVEAGVTDLGIEPKGLRLETFQRITGIRDGDLALRYSRTQWAALKHAVDEHSDRLFVGVGLPYNEQLIGMEEIREIGARIASIDDSLQIVVLDYFPEFRRTWLRRPSSQQMMDVKKVLNEAGLKTVLVQTWLGHIGP